MANGINNGRKLLPLFLSGWLNSPRLRPYLRVLFTLVIVVAGGRTVLQSYRMGMDFQWDATYLLLQGVNPYTATAEGIIVEPQLFPLLVPYLPSTLLLLTPYALVPYEIARHLWIGSNVVFTFGTVFLLFPVFLDRRGTVNEVLSLVAIWVISTPWSTGMSLGQHTLFALFFFVVALYFGKKQRAGWAGIFLAFAWLKYVVTFPLALYFVHKRWTRALGIAIGVHLLLHGIAAFLLQESSWELFLQPLRVAPIMLERGGFLDLTAVQRLVVFLFPEFRVWVVGLYTFAVVGAILLVFIAYHAAPQYETYVLTILCMATLILLYSINYDFVILILPLFFLLYKDIKPLPQSGHILLALAIGGVFYVTRITNIVVGVTPIAVATVIAQVTLLSLVTLYYATVSMLFAKSRALFY